MDDLQGELTTGDLFSFPVRKWSEEEAEEQLGSKTSEGRFYCWDLLNFWCSHVLAFVYVLEGPIYVIQSSGLLSL